LLRIYRKKCEELNINVNSVFKQKI
jgi:hypothetical protein